MRSTLFLVSILLAAGITSAREAAPFRAGTQEGAKKPAAPAEDRRKIVEEVKVDLSKAVDELNRDNTGVQTSAAMRRILENIDRLLRQEDDPTANPPSENSNPPMPPKAQPKPPQAKSPTETPSPQETEAQPKPAEPKATVEPTQSKEQPQALPNNLRDLAKEQSAKGRWGEMPWRANVEIDAVMRDRFIRNYEELLREYYRSLAESGRRGQ